MVKVTVSSAGLPSISSVNSTTVREDIMAPFGSRFPPADHDNRPKKHDQSCDRLPGKLLEPRRHFRTRALSLRLRRARFVASFASCGRHSGRGRRVRRGTGVPRSAFHDVTPPPCSARLGVGRSTSATSPGFRRGRDEVFRGTDRNGSKVHAEEGDSAFNAATPDNVWRRFRTAAFEVRVETQTTGGGSLSFEATDARTTRSSGGGPTVQDFSTRVQPPTMA